MSERFWAKVQKSAGCWEWQACRTDLGYGRFQLGQRTIRHAHRVAWMLTHGDIPEGVWVLHRCDNPPCVRPEHLFLGTSSDNIADAKAKRRIPSGERHPHTSLTVDDVLAIRILYRSGTTTLAKLGERYGVSAGAILAIVKGRNWRYVPGAITGDGRHDRGPAARRRAFEKRALAQPRAARRK